MIMKQIITVTFLLLLTLGSMAQKRASKERFKAQTYIGIVPTMDVTSRANIGMGFSFEQRLSKNLGYETGMYYRSRSLTRRYYGNILRESYMSIPIFFKYYNNVLNVSIGLDNSFMINWKQLNLDSSSQIETQNPRAFDGGIMFKIGKDIRLCKKLIFEPEMTLQQTFYNSQATYFSVGLKFKYGGRIKAN